MPIFMWSPIMMEPIFLDENVDPFGIGAKCDVVVKKIADWWPGYKQEVKDTWGARIFIKDVKHQPYKQKWERIWEQETPDVHKGLRWKMKRVIQFVPNKISKWWFGEPYDLHFMGWPDRLVRMASKKIGKRKEKELTIFSHLVPYTILYMLAYSWLDDKYKKKFGEMAVEEIEAHAAEWDAVIKNDYRFLHIKELLEKGMDPVRARQEAFLMNKTLQTYFSFVGVEQEGMKPEDREGMLMAFPFFAHVAAIKEAGVPTGRAEFQYLEGFQAKPSAKQISDLIAVTEMLLIQQQIAHEIVKPSPSAKADLESEEGKTIADGIRNDPFSKVLFKLRSDNKIDDDQLIYRLQEDAFWKARFLEHKVLRIQKRKEENDVLTNKPLTLQDIRDETLQEILSP